MVLRLARNPREPVANEVSGGSGVALMVSLEEPWASPPQLIPQLDQEALKQATHSSRRQEGVKALLKRVQPFKSLLHACMHIQVDPLSQRPALHR